MPPRDPALPEGTDHIVTGAGSSSTNPLGGGGPGRASAIGQTGGPAGGQAGGSAGSSPAIGGASSSPASTSGGAGRSRDDGGDHRGGKDQGGGSSGSGFNTDKIVGQVRDQIGTLRDQAADKARSFADDGKNRATGMLDDLGAVIDEAARSVDERLGSDYGEYAHRAAKAVESLSQNLRDKSIEDLLDDTRSIVRKSPGVAIGTAAVLGFALIRLVKTGLEDAGGSDRADERGRSQPGTARPDASGGV